MSSAFASNFEKATATRAKNNKAKLERKRQKFKREWLEKAIEQEKASIDRAEEKVQAQLEQKLSRKYAMAVAVMNSPQKIADFKEVIKILENLDTEK
jgi:hypothetical protein